MEKVYLSSINDELLFDSLEECVEFIVDNSESPLTKTIQVFEKYQPTHEDLLDVDCIADNLACRADAIGGEYAEDYASELHYCKETKGQLFNLVLNWMNDNIDQPTFYTTGKELEVLDVTEALYNSLNIDID